MRSPLAALLALVVVVTATGALAQSSGCDDAGYCSGRGIAYTDTQGQCQCRCTVPYHGYRCFFSYETNSTVECSGTFYSQSEAHCAAAAPACFWNTTTDGCEARRSAIRTTDTSSAVAIPWCHNAFPLPFIMVVYAIATLAFGFCAVAIVYLGRYYDVFSRVEDSGERVFNQFYNGTAPFIVYSCIIVFFSGGLAVTSWINLQDEQSCVYVVWVYMYLIVQIAPLIIIPLYYLILWIIRKCAGAGDILFDLEEHIAPKTTMATEHRHTNQIRCY